MVCERTLVQVLVGSFSGDKNVWWLSVGLCSDCEQQKDCFVGSGMVPSRFEDGFNLGEGNCHRSTVWLGGSVVRVLVRYAGGPGFESRSGHMLLAPMRHSFSREPISF